MPGVFPGLVADPVVTAKDPKLHIGIVLHGLAGKAIDRKAYSGLMHGFRPRTRTQVIDDPRKNRNHHCVFTLTQQPYASKKWSLAGLQGISDKTLEVHFGLYEGYVKNTNLLNEQLGELMKNRKAAGSDPHFAELTRRLGFEYNGMRLHEYYFDNLTASGGGSPSNKLADALGGDVETWKKNFTAVGGMRGVGWAIAYQDPWTGRISNHWVTLHEDGNIAGFTPVLVMDVWEHAFLFDYKPSERSKYIESFMANIDWSAVEARLQAPRLPV